MTQPLRKEDLPDDVRKEIEDKLMKENPGFEIKYAGDVDESEWSPGLIARSDQLFASFRDSITEGVCAECGAKIPGIYPPAENDEDWPPEGWVAAVNIADGSPMFLVCPECDEDDEDFVEDDKNDEK